MNVVIRQGRESDRSFLFSTWLLGLYHGNDWFKEIDKTVYFKVYKAVVEGIIAHSRVDVACLPDDEDVVLGYVVYSGNTLHWIFVKKPWRKLGIAKKLMPQGITTCTHLTKIGKSLRPVNVSFNPFLGVL